MNWGLYISSKDSTPSITNRFPHIGEKEKRKKRGKESKVTFDSFPLFTFDQCADSTFLPVPEPGIELAPFRLAG